MATSGNYNTSNQYIVYWIEYWLNSQDINNNSSNITVKVWVKRTNAGYTTRGTGSVALNIDGNVYSQEINSSQLITNNPICLIEKTVDVKHSDDGSKTVLLESSINHSQFSTTIHGLNWTLQNIPRTSGVSCADGFVGGTTTIAINRASSSFTHTLRYNFNGYIQTIVEKTGYTILNWTIPAEFFGLMTNSNNGVGTMYCDTYQGDILIGTSSCKFNVYVINSNPEITATIEDVNPTTINLTGNKNKLIKYKSNARVIINATAKNGASIISQNVICGNKYSDSVDSTLYEVESGTFNLSCTDSRNNVGQSTINKDFVDYILLAFTNIEIKREHSTSNTINVDLKGNFFNKLFGKEQNSLSLKWRYRIKNGNWSSYKNAKTINSGNTFSYSGDLGVDFDFNNEYEFEFVAKDLLMEVSANKIVTRGEPIIDIGKNDVRINGDVNSKNVLCGNFSTTQSVPSKTPTRLTIPLNKELKDAEYMCFSQAHGDSNYGDWISSIQCFLLNSTQLQVVIFNHGDGPTTGTIYIDFLIMKKSY